MNVEPAPPRINGPNPLFAVEDLETVLAGIAVEDVDGVLDLGVSFVEFGDPFLDLRFGYVGAAEGLAPALSRGRIVPPPDFSGSLALLVNVNDGPHAVTEVLITDVAPAPPQILLPNDLTLSANIDSRIPGIRVFSADGLVSLEFTVDRGRINGNFRDINARDISFTADDIVRYRPAPDQVGPVELTLTVLDGPHRVSAQTTFKIEVPPPEVPVLGKFAFMVSTMQSLGIDLM